MPNKQAAGAQTHLHTWAAVLLLGVLFAQTITDIPRNSITFDENVHITTGYSILRTGDFRLIKAHPPLLEVWTGWPIALDPNMPDPRQVPAWEQGDRPLFARNKVWWNIPIDSWVIPSRIPVTWLALLLGAFVFRWASDWFGPRAGLLALALLAFDPNILAHASVATGDLGVTCLIFISMYGFQRLLRRPSGTSLVVNGILLGLALVSKISAAILVPITGGLTFLWTLKQGRFAQQSAAGQQSSRIIRAWAVRLAIYFGVAFLTLWAVHLFEFGRPPGWPFPVPAPTYLRSFLRVEHHLTTGNWTFLLGERYYGGRWYYFPITFALKTPLPTLILLGVALVVAYRQRPFQPWRALTLASLPVIYSIISVSSSINLGYRHLLPILPFLYVLIASLAGPWMDKLQPTNHRVFSHWRAILLSVLVLWQAIGTLLTWPFYLTFFNEIVGGSRNGYRYMADSNADWGQALKALRDYLETHHLSNPQLSTYTHFVLPELYGIQAAPLPPLKNAPPILPARFNPAPGDYVISASTLRGLQLADAEMYNWFWHREPDDVVANAMLVYHVAERTPRPTWLAQCIVPVDPLSPEVAAEGFGRADLRLVYFDCTQSWFYPTGGQSPGWVALAGESPVLKNSSEMAWAQRYLAATRLSFEQKRAGFSPPFRIYQDDGRMAYPQGGQVRVAPSEQELAEALTARPVDLPVTFEGGLTLLGYRLDHPKPKPGETVHVEIAWRVDDVPRQLLSLMAHALGPDGLAVAVGDGLGVPIENWQVGDIFVQRHTLTLPKDIAPGQYWIQTGVYGFDDGKRWPVRDARATGDRALLTALEVRR